MQYYVNFSKASPLYKLARAKRVAKFDMLKVHVFGDNFLWWSHTVL